MFHKSLKKIKVSDFKKIFFSERLVFLKPSLKKEKKPFQVPYFYGMPDHFFCEKIFKTKTPKLEKKGKIKNFLETSKRDFNLTLFEKPNFIYFSPKLRFVFLSLLRQKQLNLEYQSENVFLSSVNSISFESNTYPDSKAFKKNSKKFFKSLPDSNVSSVKMRLQQRNGLPISPVQFKNFSKSLSSMIFKEKISLSSFQFFRNFAFEKFERKNLQKFIPDAALPNFSIPSYLFELQKKISKWTKFHKVEKRFRSVSKGFERCESFKLYFFSKFFQIFIDLILATYASTLTFTKIENKNLVPSEHFQRDAFKEIKFSVCFLKEVYRKLSCFYRQHFLGFQPKISCAKNLCDKEKYLQIQDFSNFVKNNFFRFSKNFLTNSSSIHLMRLNCTLKNVQKGIYENSNRSFNKKFFFVFFLSSLQYLKNKQKWENFRLEFPFFRFFNFASFGEIVVPKNSKNLSKSTFLTPVRHESSFLLNFLETKFIEFEKNLRKKLFLSSFQKIQHQKFQFEIVQHLDQNLYDKDKFKSYLINPKKNNKAIHPKMPKIDFLKIPGSSFLTVTEACQSSQRNFVFRFPGLFGFYFLLSRKTFLSQFNFLGSRTETWFIFYQKSLSRVFLLKFIRKWYIWQSLYEGNFLNREVFFQEIFFLTQNFSQKTFFFQKLHHFSKFNFHHFHLTNLYRFLSSFGFCYDHCFIILKSPQSFLIFPDELNVFDYFKNFQKKLTKSATKSQDWVVKEMSFSIYAWCYANRFISSELWLKVSDFRIFDFLWQWACRRHNNKSKQWIRKKYFSPWNAKIWIFAYYLENQTRFKSLDSYFPLFVYLPFHTQILKKLQAIKKSPSPP